MTLADAISLPAAPLHPAPVRARTETLDYQFPPCRPTTVPPADQCSDDELLDLAAGAAQHPDQLWALLGSGEHVAAICQLLAERVWPGLRDSEERLRDANGHIENHQRMLACAQAEIAKLEDQLDGSDRAVMGQQLEIGRLRQKLAASEAAHKETLAECCALLRESIKKAGGK